MTDPEFCRITINGASVLVLEGSSVASVLLNHGLAGPQAWSASPSPSTPICGMGSCWGCRATIDDIADRRACLVTVRHGMVVVTEPAPAGPQEIGRTVE